ncbi:MAG: carbohydrate-binding domain-containing protein, partial [Muribaculaceae bacterium]|nr:carbohydrate-binding domain-containing protein [Muribaculaceae bacterium]
MKKLMTLLGAAAIVTMANSQTMNVVTGDVTYAFVASQAGTMPFADGTQVTVQGKAFALVDVTRIYIDDQTVSDNTVTVTYSGAQATVSIAGNVAQYVEVDISGGHVTIAQSDEVSADNVGEITYTLTGTATDGSFSLSGSYKATVALNGVSITNPAGAAISITNGKRIAVSVKSGTTNSLTDGAGAQKGCFYCKGHAEFKGTGTLNVTGNYAHGIKGGEYVTIKNCTINVLGAVKDGINCCEYFMMESGTLTIADVGDDGIQCDVDGTASTGETTDHEDEDSGNIYLVDGTVTISASAIAAKGIKAEGDLKLSGGTITVTTTGDGEWDDDDSETKAASCLSSDGNMSIAGGKLTLTSTGSGGKGAKCDGSLAISDGTVTIKTTGGLFYSNGTTTNTNYTGDTDNLNSDYYSSPKGIKAGVKDTNTGNIDITGGTVNVTTSGHNGEGIESKYVMTIAGGTVTVNSYDDGLNSASHMYLNGGTVTVVASQNDAIDSNGDMHVGGGTIIACGASGAECGLDAAEGYSLYITGGTVMGIGGDNNEVSSTSGSQAVLSTSGTVSAGTTVSIKSGSTTVASFTVPSSYSSNSSDGHGGPGGQGGSTTNIL